MSVSSAEAVAKALAGTRWPVAVADIAALETTGLAHDHFRLGETGLLARVPRQSQLALDPDANLAYQAACFTRAGAGGHAPRLDGVLEPGPDLPMGALLVERIDGEPLPLPGGLPALAGALAALHGLPLPADGAQGPLMAPADPLADTLSEIAAQAVFLDAAGLDPDAARQIDIELSAARAQAAVAGRPPVTLIAFDAHPGNFLLTGAGRAVLVDLEKARYGLPGLDLAHATLYTSTTWDVATRAELDHDQVAGVYTAWLDAVPAPLAAATRPWLLALRRVMWLWSVSWCAKWRVQSRATVGGSGTENWSAELSAPELVAHVADRVADYLDPATIARVRADWRGDNTLTALLGPADAAIPNSR
ncbi:MAG: phosphotransferase [Alphaproteobacteria bacterium]